MGGKTIRHFDTLRYGSMVHRIIVINGYIKLITNARRRLNIHRWLSINYLYTPVCDVCVQIFKIYIWLILTRERQFSFTYMHQNNLPIAYKLLFAYVHKIKFDILRWRSHNYLLIKNVNGAKMFACDLNYFFLVYTYSHARAWYECNLLIVPIKSIIYIGELFTRTIEISAYQCI